MTKELTGKQLAEKIMEGMNYLKQLAHLSRIIDLQEKDVSLAALYLMNLPRADKVKIVGYFEAVRQGNEAAAI